MKRYRSLVALVVSMMGALMFLQVTQALANGTMTVKIVGSGSGTVDSTTGAAGGGFLKGIPPIECSYDGLAATGVCEDELSVENEFEGTGLRQVASPGSEFVKWVVNKGGFFNQYCGAGEEPNAKKYCTPLGFEGEESEFEVTAEFKLLAPGFPLEITLEGLGEGEVSCEVNGGPTEPCEAEYEEGTEVALVPEAETGSEFAGWGEDCAETGACELTMDEAHEVSASFEVEQVTLTVQVEGPGSVTAPEDIDCPGVCSGNYSLGEEVEVSATPDEGALFLEWTGPGAGSCAGSSNPVCEVEMNGDKTVKAVFEAGPQQFLLSVAKAGTGQGTVTSSPSGIDCGSTCKALFEEETEVTLKATPASGSTFAGWSGACSGPEACKVTMSEARAVTATFTAEALNPPPPPPPGAGIAKVASVAKVKAGKAQLKLTCTGEGACKGSLKLTAKVKSGGKTKTLTIGKGSFSLAKGAKSTLKVKLSGPAKQALAKGPLKAKVKGTGLAASSVKLKA